MSLVADDSPAEPLGNLPFDYRLGPRHLYAPPAARALFTDNETNAARLRAVGDQPEPYVKDAFHRHVVDGELRVNPTRAARRRAPCTITASVPAGGSGPAPAADADVPDADPLADVDEVVRRAGRRPTSSTRRSTRPKATEDERLRPAPGAWPACSGRSRSTCST